MKILAKRSCSGVAVLLAVVLPAFWMPSLGIMMMLIAISSLALLEFYRLLELIGGKVFKGVGLVFGMLITVGTWASLALGADAWWEPHLPALLAVALFLRLFPQKNNAQQLATASYTAFGVLYVSVLFNYFTRLVFAWEPSGTMGLVGDTGCILFFYLLAVVKTSDIGAYFIGNKWGRHKLIPRISPGKTWEGCAGGIAFGLAGSLIVFLICGGQMGIITMTMTDALFLGLLLPILGMAGDLGESMLKRAADVKDSGIIMPGLGGALDVLDSLLFSVPALYLYVMYVLAP